MAQTKKIVIITILCVITLFSILGTVSAETKYNVSGYVLDSSGNGISGASITFNNPSLVPGTETDATGYYEVYAPAGTYIVDVWPPYDSSFLNYRESTFVVSSDNIHDMTMTQGVKLSGYIYDTTGSPIQRICVSLDGTYVSGYITGTSGYYYVVAPAGTYSLILSYSPDGYTPSTTVYTETNYALTSDTTKDITIPNPSLSVTPETPFGALLFFGAALGAIVTYRYKGNIKPYLQLR